MYSSENVKISFTICKTDLKAISHSLCRRCGGLSIPALCYSWSATSEAEPMAGAVWFWLRSSRQQQCQRGREEWARLQRCGWPSGQLSQQQYCSGTQGGLYPAFWWSYLVSSSCCLLVISAWVTHFKAGYSPLSFSPFTRCLSHSVYTFARQTNKHLLASTSVHRWTPAMKYLLFIQSLLRLFILPHYECSVWKFSATNILIWIESC